MAEIELTANEERYVILKLSDVKLISRLIREQITDADSAYSYVHQDIDRQLEPIKPILKRFDDETGADMLDIVAKLKNLDFCSACVIEGQQDSCNSLVANKLGRRLKRLVDRADGNAPDNDATSSPSEASS